MKLKCEECGSRENEFNEELGETCCSNCGLVLDIEIFEQTTLGISGDEATHSKNLDIFGRGLGSQPVNLNTIRTTSVRKKTASVLPAHLEEGLAHCNMVYVHFSHILNQEEMHKLYLELFNKNVFTVGDTYESRAIALVYYMLTINGTPHSYEEVADDLKIEISKAKKLVRRIKVAKGFRPLPVNNHFLLDKVLNKLALGQEFRKEATKAMEFFETLWVGSDFTKQPIYYECICWITANAMNMHREITQSYIAEKTGRDRNKIRLRTNDIIKYLRMNSIKEIRGKKIW